MTESLQLAWPPGRPRVLVTDCWLTNAGDAAIAVATQRLVEKHAPSAAVLHAAYGADIVGDRYPELRFVPPLEAIVGTRWAKPSAARDTDDGLRFVTEADLVISQGGGFLREEYQPWSRLDALSQATTTGVRLLLLGQTIGRYDRTLARRMLRDVLRTATVVVRDPMSLLHTLDLGADATTTFVGTDLALGLVDAAVDRPTTHDAPISVVLTDYAVERGRPSRGTLATALLAAVAAHHPNRTLLVWSSAQGAGDDRDELVAEAAVTGLPAEVRQRVELIEGHVDAHQLLELTRSSAAVISMRFHPALLAAAQGTPTVLVLDDQKAGAFDGTPMAARVVRGTVADAGALLGDLRPLPAGILGDLPVRLDAMIRLVATNLQVGQSADQP